MKQTMVLFLTLSSIATAQAQQWCPPGAEWHYDGYACQFCPGYIRMRNMGDTTINGQPCSRVERIRFYQVIDSPVYVDTLTSLYTYGDTGIVWMFDPQLNAFDTLYDFNAPPGDSWQLIHLPEPAFSEPTFFLTVLDTGHINIDGTPLRWLSVQYNFGDLWSDQTFLDTLIERIGSIDWYMLPYSLPNGATDAGEGGPLRCYHDNEISYQRPSVQSCELPLAVTEHAARPRILVYPNPGTDVLHIEASAKGRLEVRVQDATGRQAVEASAPAGSLELSSVGLSPGIYLIEVNTAEGRRTVKWMKQ
ncbi:MAG: T9SS type A sorting domain-containing protein [Bacteroidetes bacterium]|nr:T9SS type A sorting domain-containing protein [Bacteroidota bacterium]MBS1940914.1 T9SS type A sorting domain-containing protein [Bacteroidota bacterium]